jgi:hypothetical protein
VPTGVSKEVAEYDDPFGLLVFREWTESIRIQSGNIPEFVLPFSQSLLILPGQNKEHPNPIHILPPLRLPV